MCILYLEKDSNQKTKDCTCYSPDDCGVTIEEITTTKSPKTLKPEDTTEVTANSTSRITTSTTSTTKSTTKSTTTSKTTSTSEQGSKANGFKD